MKFHSDVDQNTAEWRSSRLGIPTASHFASIITQQGKPSEARERDRYKYRLVAERILSKPIDDSYTNRNMARGLELEDAAAQALRDR